MRMSYKHDNGEQFFIVVNQLKPSMNPPKVFQIFYSGLVLVIALVFYVIEIVPLYAEMFRGPNALGYMVCMIIIVVVFIPYKQIAHKKVKFDGYKIVAMLVIFGFISYTELSSPTIMNLADNLRRSINLYIYIFIF